MGAKEREALGPGSHSAKNGNGGGMRPSSGPMGPRAAPIALGLACSARLPYNASREFCFRARWKSSLAVSTGRNPARARDPAFAQADPV